MKNISEKTKLFGKLKAIKGREMISKKSLHRNSKNNYHINHEFRRLSSGVSAIDYSFRYQISIYVKDFK